VSRMPLKKFTLPLLLLGFAAMAMAQESGAKAEETGPGIGWTWANFAILVIGLGYIAAKTLPGAFRDRNAAIQKGIAEAQQIKKDAERRAAEVESRLRDLGADIERFRTQSRLEMQQEGERIRQETAHEVARLERQAQIEIEAAGKTARRELKTYAASLALDMAEQRLRARLDASTEAGLVDSFIQDLRGQESRN